MGSKSLRCGVAIAVAAGCLAGGVTAAQAAKLTVDDDRFECPSAGFTSIQAAVDAAAPNDVIAICDGVYREGPGTVGSSGVTIDKPLTLRGAGAGRVFVAANGGANRVISPDPAAPNVRDETGNVISIVETGDVGISGITVWGDRVTLDTGIAFVRSSGSLVSVEVVDLAPAAGLGTSQGGVGVVVHNGPTAADTGPGLLENVTIRDSVVEGYNRAGIVFDARRPDDSSQTTLTKGVVGVVASSRVTGAGEQASIAQNGIEFNHGAYGNVIENAITANHYRPDPAQSAGIRFFRSVNDTGQQGRFNMNTIAGNGIGLFHESQTATYRVDAIRNWWGSPLGPTVGAQTDRGDAVSGTAAAQANQTTAVNYNGFLTAPAPMDVPLNEWQDQQPSVALSADGTQTAALVATADDDIGVRSVAFYAGDRLLATDTTAPYEASLPLAAGTTQAITAVATDSRGQTGSASTALTRPVPQPSPDDAAPRVQITAPAPGNTNGRRVTATATATDDRGVQSVTFLLGTRRVCTDTTAPYSCTVTAGRSDVGRQILTVIATDSAGQTATAQRTLVLPRAKPSRLTHTTKRVAGRLATSGRLMGAQGCKGGLVTISYSRGGRLVNTRLVKLNSACAYSARTALSRGAYSVRVAFRGSDTLAAIAGPTRKATVR